MKHCPNIVITLIFTVAITAYAHAGSDNATHDENWPTGMTLKKVGGSNVVVPEGTRIRREGDVRIVEGTGEYAARNFVEIDQHFKKIESEISVIRKELDEIKKTLSEIHRSDVLLKSK